MSEITIPKSEYDSLLSDRTNLKGLQEKLQKVEEASESKSKAIEEERKKNEDLKKKNKEEIDTRDIQLSEYQKKLEGIDGGLDTLLDSHKQHSARVEQEKQERVKKIEEYKKTLGDDFLKSKESLLNGLDDHKIEAFLKEFVDMKTPPSKNPPKVEIPTGTPPSAGGGDAKVDQLYQSNANAFDMISAME